MRLTRVAGLCYSCSPRRMSSRLRELSGRSAAWLARLVRDQEVEGSNPFAPTTPFRTNNLQTHMHPLTAWCRARRSADQIESLRLRYCPLSHRFTSQFRDVRQHMETVQLVQHLSDDFANGQGIRLRSGCRICFGKPKLVVSRDYYCHRQIPLVKLTY